jgi:hypothetical protein
MTEEILFNKYPKIFELMTDNYYSISTSIPKGWINIIDLLCESIQNHTDNINNSNKHLPPVSQTVVEQIKSKYGGLRFYYHGGDNNIEGMVNFAETIANHTCEVCGKSGELINQNGWLSVL